MSVGGEAPSTIQCSTAVGERPRLALKLFRGERDISGFDWPFTPIHGSSPPFSTEVGSASTGSYPRFSLPMDSSPGFASAACDSIAILKARFHCGSVQTLTSPHTATRWLILQRHAVTPLGGSDCL